VKRTLRFLLSLIAAAILLAIGVWTGAQVDDLTRKSNVAGARG
jgi:hypothetical protein